MATQAQKAAAEKAAAEKEAAEKAAADAKLAADQAEAERIAFEKKAAEEKAAADKAAADQAEADRLETERLEVERLAAEQPATDSDEEEDGAPEKLFTSAVQERLCAVLDRELSLAERDEQSGPGGSGWLHNESLLPGVKQWAAFLRAAKQQLANR